MKVVVEQLLQHNIICKRLELFDLSQIGSKKRLKVYFGVDIQSHYTLIFSVTKKSRILSKEALDIITLSREIETFHGGMIKKKYILIYAPLCSKAKKFLEESGFVVF